jgi:uncharacterized iron-regulated membrane protein
LTLGHAIGAEAALQAARHASPEPIDFLRVPDGVWSSWTAYSTRDGDRWLTAIDPGSGTVLGTRDNDRALMSVIYALHADLLLRPFWGEQMVGVLGLVLLISAGSGLYLWWPRREFWRSMVTLRIRPRVMFYLDLHRLGGVWTALVLLLVAFTGVGVVFPGLIRPAVSLASKVASDPSPMVASQGRPYTIDLDRAVAIAEAHAPQMTPTFVGVAQAPGNVWLVGLKWRDANEAYLVAGLLWIDPWTGTIVADRSPSSMNAGTGFMGLQLWLHNGSVFGWVGRIAVFLAGLILPTLFVTGLLAWLRKRRARRRLESRKTEAVQGIMLPL